MSFWRVARGTLPGVMLFGAACSRMWAILPSSSRGQYGSKCSCGCRRTRTPCANALLATRVRVHTRKLIPSRTLVQRNWLPRKAYMCTRSQTHMRTHIRGHTFTLTPARRAMRPQTATAPRTQAHIHHTRGAGNEWGRRKCRRGTMTDLCRPKATDLCRPKATDCFRIHRYTIRARARMRTMGKHQSGDGRARYAADEMSQEALSKAIDKVLPEIARGSHL